MFLKLYIYFFIFLASGAFFLSLNILLKNPRSPLHIMFFVKTLMITAYILFAALTQSSTNIEELIFFQKSRMIVITLYFALFFHFLIILTEKKISRIFITLIYLGVLLVVTVLLFSENTVSNVRKIGNFWIYFDNYYNTLWGLLFYFTSFLYGVFALYLLFRRMHSTSLIKEKKQCFYIILTLSIPLLLGSITDVIIPFLFLDFTPHLMPFFVAFYIIGIYYAFSKYKLLNFNVRDLFEEILSNISDMVLILNTSGGIIKANDKYIKTFLHHKDSLITKKFDEFININQSLKNNLDNLFKGKIKVFNEMINIKSENETITADSYFSRITDTFGDFMGILVILKENRNINAFKRKYKLTERQFEIIMLAVNGLTNNEICERLNIKRRTIENHFFTIYNKLLINNKVELVKLASDFQII